MLAQTLGLICQLPVSWWNTDFFLSRSCSMAILDFYQLRRKQRSTDPKTTFLTTIIPTDVLLCLLKHFMKVEGNNEILLKTLKSLQKHYIRIEIYRLMSSQTKISSLELYSILFCKIIKVAEKKWNDKVCLTCTRFRFKSKHLQLL